MERDKKGQSARDSIPVTEQRIDGPADLREENSAHREPEENLGTTALTSKIRKSFIDIYGDSTFPPYYLFLTNPILLPAAQGVRLSESQLPWVKLPKLTAEQGLSIINWPDLVPFPGEKKKIVGGGKTQSSIKCLSASELMALYMVFQDPATAPQLVKMGREGTYLT